MAPQTDPWDDWESEDYSRSSKPGTGSKAADPSISANAKLWQVANSSLSFVPSTNASSNASTPASVYSYQSTSSTNMPPPQAFMPSLKILKRPSGTGSGSTSPSSSINGDASKNAKQTLQDRERAYRVARSRIFGAEEKESTAASPPASVPPSVPASTENSESEENPPARRTREMSSLGLRKKSVTTGSTLLREPINPPTAQKGKSNKGFTRTRRSKTPLSPAAQVFTPSFLKSDDKSLDSQMQRLEV